MFLLCACDSFFFQFINQSIYLFSKLHTNLHRMTISTVAVQCCLEAACFQLHVTVFVTTCRKQKQMKYPQISVNMTY